MDKYCNSRRKLNNAGTEIKNSSFLLKIRYNQNNTIQGSIQWLEKKKTICFRSMMELMKLLIEANGNDEYRTWDGEEGAISEVQILRHISNL